MSTIVIIILVEVFVVLLVIASFLLYLRRKRKKLKSAEIEKLLDNINSQQTERQSLLINHMKENYDLQNDSAGESCQNMIEAEKQFLQPFLKQQIEQTPLTDFYSNLCELLDQYIYLLTPIKTEQNISNDEAPLVIAETIDSVEDEFDIGDITTNEDETIIEPEKKADLEDEFAESDDVVDEIADAETNSEVAEAGLEDEFAETEPDWGDAFAESGDEVDKATKDNYEANLKSKGSE